MGEQVADLAAARMLSTAKKFARASADRSKDRPCGRRQGRTQSGCDATQKLSKALSAVDRMRHDRSMVDNSFTPGSQVDVTEDDGVVEVRWCGGIEFHRNHYFEPQSMSTLIDDTVDEFRERLQAAINEHFA